MNTIERVLIGVISNFLITSLLLYVKLLFDSKPENFYARKLVKLCLCCCV